MGENSSPMTHFMRRRPVQIGLAVIGAANFLHAAVMAQDAFRTYYASDPYGRDVVTIVSQAPLETMTTRTSAVQADVRVNPRNVLDHPRARFVVDLTTLDTGIAMRNDHMKSEAWINIAKYPKAVFNFTKVVSPPPRKVFTTQNGQKGTLTLEGELDFHGVKKTVRARVFCEAISASDATKDRLKGDLIHIRAVFPLKMDDFGVQIPALAKLKIANVEEVTVDVFVSTGSDKPAWVS